MTTPNMNAPLTGCTTIDSSADPQGNRYLANARVGNPNAGANGATHVAAANLLACGTPTARLANIVGHGQEGDIDTGAANHECITTTNEDSWRADLTTLRGHVTELFLFGCGVGGGQLGARLLHDIAVAINARVSAPTGLIYCDASGIFTLERGATWQSASPTTLPAAIEPPDHALTRSHMTQSGNSTAGASRQILAATYTPASKDSAVRAFSPETSLKLAHEVIWESFTPPGEPGAKVTGQLQVTFEGSRPQSYTIYNHVLLRQDDEPNFYHATRAFRSIVTGR